MNSVKKGGERKSWYIGEVEILEKKPQLISEAVPNIRGLISAQLNNSQFYVYLQVASQEQTFDNHFG